MNKDLKFIKDFSKITIKKACETEQVNSSNLFAGRTKQENYKKVRSRIEKEIENLYKGE